MKWFDRLIPEDDPSLKAQKDLERQAIERRMARSKLAEMMTAKREKVSWITKLRIIWKNIIISSRENLLAALCGYTRSDIRRSSRTISGSGGFQYSLHSTGAVALTWII